MTDTGMTIAIYAFTFLFGIVVGSFLNVCILRLPKGESIVSVPSHCTSCGKRLRPWELVPLFSWLALRGRCARCKAPVSPQYPLVEAGNGILWLVILRALSGAGVPEPSLYPILAMLFASALLVIAFIDARTREIHPGVVVFIAVLGAVRFALYREAWLDTLLGPAVCGGALLLILLLSGGRAMGGGDVKLIAAAGLFLGFRLTLLGMIFACFLGAVIHLILMKVKHLGRELAFGPYLAGGLCISMLWGTRILDWYLAFF